MAMQYFNQIKNRRRSSQIVKPPDPVLTAEDEAFLQRVTSQPEDKPSSAGLSDTRAAESPAGSPQHPVVNEDAQDALNIPLPASPAEEFGKELGEVERKEHEKGDNTETSLEPAASAKTAAQEKNKKKRWSAMFWKKNADTGKVRNSRVNSLTL